MYEKGQNTRLFDTFLLGPFMLWFAVSASGMPLWARMLLGVSGVGTVTYNWANYAANEWPWLYSPDSGGGIQT